MENFNKRIILLLDKNNMTQKDLAKQIGVNEATISRYMSGERMPKSEHLANIAIALHTTTDFLLGIEQDDEFNVNKTARLIARNANKISESDKKALIDAIFGVIK